MTRFTISVTPGMKVELDHAKKERYYNVTQNGMIRDLILRGLQTSETPEPIEIIDATERFAHSTGSKKKQGML